MINAAREVSFMSKELKKNFKHSPAVLAEIASRCQSFRDGDADAFTIMTIES